MTHDQTHSLDPETGEATSSADFLGDKDKPQKKAQMEDMWAAHENGKD